MLAYVCIYNVYIHIIYVYVYILYIALYYGYLPSFGYVRTSSLEVCELFYKHK